jgi:hypothetical protein
MDFMDIVDKIIPIYFSHDVTFASGFPCMVLGRVAPIDALQIFVAISELGQIEQRCPNRLVLKYFEFGMGSGEVFVTFFDFFRIQVQAKLEPHDWQLGDENDSVKKLR